MTFFAPSAIVNVDRARVYGAASIVNADHCNVHGDASIVNGNHCRVYGKACIVNGNYCEVYHPSSIINGSQCIRKYDSSVSKTPTAKAMKPPSSSSSTATKKDRERDRSPETRRRYTASPSVGASDIVFTAPGGITTMHAKGATICNDFSGGGDGFTTRIVDPRSGRSVVHVSNFGNTGSFVGISYGNVVQSSSRRHDSGNDESRPPRPPLSRSSSGSSIKVPSVPPPLKDEPSAVEGESECSICTDRAVKTTCVPCGHQCLCVTCANELVHTHHKHTCPICNEPLTSVIRTYGSAAAAAVAPLSKDADTNKPTKSH